MNEYDAALLAQATQPRCRLVRISEDLLDLAQLRTVEGCLLTARWGDPDQYGVYEPSLTMTYDGWLEAKLAEARRPLEAQIAALVETCWNEQFSERAIGHDDRPPKGGSDG